MTAAELLAAGDVAFGDLWRAMTDEQRAALPDAERAKCISRFRKITAHVGSGSEKLARAQADTSTKKNGDGKRLPPDTTAPIDGAALLDDVFALFGRFVVFPSLEAKVAITLWCGHAHSMESFESTPRLALLSPEPASGKTRAIEVIETLVPRPVEAINVTPAYLFRKVADPDGTPTILFDEIDTLFGPRAKDHEEVRGVLNAGHRRGATAGRCVVRGKIIETEELPAYCAVALAGLGNLPETILQRAVVIRMRRRAPTEQVEPFRRRIHAPLGNALRDRLAAWAAQVRDKLEKVPQMPDGLADRHADVWEALLCVADAAGGDWPEVARVSAVALVAASKAGSPSLGIRLLTDLRQVFAEMEAMSTADIIAALTALDEAPWGDLKGKPIDARRLSNLLRPFGVSSKTVRIGHSTPKGYARIDLRDPWVRYLSTTDGEARTSDSSGGINDSQPGSNSLTGSPQHAQHE